MRAKTKSLMAGLLTLAMLLSLLSVAAFAAASEEATGEVAVEEPVVEPVFGEGYQLGAATSGTCGDNLTWSLEDGVLTISGTGKMTNYGNYLSSSQPPWYSLRTNITSVVLEYGVTSIGSYAFYHCDDLTSIVIPNSITSIVDYTFYHCTGLTNITIPNGVTSIGSSAFYGCTGLTNVTISNSVTSVGDSAFKDCINLTSVTIGSGVTEIGIYAFYNCYSLTSINIPEGIVKIGIFTFDNCTSLSDVYYSGSKTEWGKVSISTGNDCLNSATIHYNCAIPEEATHTHNYTSEVTNEVTCTTAGVTTYTCSICGDTYTETVPATGHTVGSAMKENVVEATATVNGSYDSVVYCTVCGAELSRETVTVPAAGGSSATFLFSDVTTVGSWYYTAVYWAYNNGITTGTSTTLFSPSDSCTRAQFVTFLWRLAGEPAPTTTSCSFTDLDTGEYYYNAVLWAVEQGVTNGTSATAFSPNDKISRAQAVTMLYRYAGTPSVSGLSNSFADVPASEYYYNAVLWAVEQGITNGTSDTTFSPSDTCDRAMMVTYLYRYAVEPLTTG